MDEKNILPEIAKEFMVKSLGEREFPSPLIEKFPNNEDVFINDDTRLFHKPFLDKYKEEETFELAGPRKYLYFDPKKVRSAIVTCGGLSPGFNDVIRSIVMESTYRYGMDSVLGIRYGYNGLNEDNKLRPLRLTPGHVSNIHKQGGTILGSSRGGTEDIPKLVATLKKWKIDILYTIGGDGTLRGAHAIYEEAVKTGYKLSVIGVPKTIDNDISYIQRTFGFDTAFSKAVESISSAHVEAIGAPNGIGLVKLMGRHSGFIAATATLAMNDVNYILVPESKFDIEGENGFLSHLETRLRKRGHAVICIAEGAAQDILKKDKEEQEKKQGLVQRDASGNLVLGDIGIYLKQKIKSHFESNGKKVNIKYIDPSYIIRSAPANPNDSVFCIQLGQHAVHAAMSGKTDMIIGKWNEQFTHLPIELAVSKRKQIDIKSSFWHSVLEATGQPINMVSTENNDKS